MAGETGVRFSPGTHFFGFLGMFTFYPFGLIDVVFLLRCVLLENGRGWIAALFASAARHGPAVPQPLSLLSHDSKGPTNPALDSIMD